MDQEFLLLDLVYELLKFNVVIEVVIVVLDHLALINVVSLILQIFFEPVSEALWSACAINSTYRQSIPLRLDNVRVLEILVQDLVRCYSPLNVEEYQSKGLNCGQPTLQIHLNFRCPIIIPKTEVSQIG